MEGRSSRKRPFSEDDDFNKPSAYYYNSNLGYYYDPSSGLYCYATSGQWYSYNVETGSYEEVPVVESNTT